MRVSAQTEDGIGYLAGYDARLWLFVQDLDQFQQTYRKWRLMIANCAVRQALKSLALPEVGEDGESPIDLL